MFQFVFSLIAHRLSKDLVQSLLVVRMDTLFEHFLVGGRWSRRVESIEAILFLGPYGRLGCGDIFKAAHLRDLLRFRQQVSRLYERIFAAFALGDVEDHTSGLNHLARLVAVVVALGVNEALLAIFADHTVFHIKTRPVFCHGALIGGVHRLPIVRVDALKK